MQQTMTGQEPLFYDHVDVFAERALAGNGLVVVQPAAALSTATMQGIAQETRQFETIFLLTADDETVDARIFTPEEELSFAGHPVLGAAAVLHRRLFPTAEQHSWTLRIGGRPLHVTTSQGRDDIIVAEMDQGRASLSAPLSPDLTTEFAQALGLQPRHVHADLPAQVVSTGLRYLLLPVDREGLAESRVADPELPAMLAEVGAAFVYVLEPTLPEGRTWDNAGLTEDVATGSAAGPTAAYLIEHGLRAADAQLQVHQGGFLGRPSRIDVRMGSDGSIHVGGPVVPFSSGTINRSSWS